MEIKQKIKRKDLNSAGKHLISLCKGTIINTESQRIDHLVILKEFLLALAQNNQAKYQFSCILLICFS